MKALTWKEPFASLMLHDKIETRSWSTNYRGLVLICAGLTPYSDVELLKLSGVIQMRRIQERIYVEKTGVAIAVGLLVDCRPMLPNDENLAFVKYNPALYCHIYKNVRPIEPFAWKGQQGWKNVEPEIVKQIKYL